MELTSCNRTATSNGSGNGNTLRWPQAVWRWTSSGCEVTDGLPEIRADREALSRALWNLMENAAKYSDPGAEIHVFARRQGETVLLGVEDQDLKMSRTSGWISIHPDGRRIAYASGHNAFEVSAIENLFSIRRGRH